MDSLEEQLRQLTILNSRPLPPKRPEDDYVRTGKVAALVDNLQKSNAATAQRRIAPSVPPKPFKKQNDTPQVPQSKLVTDTREPLYSRPLQGLDLNGIKESVSGGGGSSGTGSMLLRKQPIYVSQGIDKANSSKSTLDNPAVLEQQLEALAYHKMQMEKKGLLGSQAPPTKTITTIPKLSSTSLSGSSSTQPAVIYSNLRTSENSMKMEDPKNIYSYMPTLPEESASTVYSNVQQRDPNLVDPLARFLSISTHSDNYGCSKETDEELPPPSPVSSSYSELRRATDVFDKGTNLDDNSGNKMPAEVLPGNIKLGHKNYAHQYTSYSPTQQCHLNKANMDYYGYGGLSQSSSTYDSIYEPINPRPPSELSSRSNYNMYASYVNGSSSNSASISMMGNINTSGTNTPMYCSGGALSEVDQEHQSYQKRDENEDLSNYLSNSMDPINEVENYGRCFKCSERVLGENSGCTAMDQIYHISCFTCSECQINLQGKPFYALEGKPYCEYDYLQTLEKCSVCLKPILERILRATGKPYHPQCFTCVVCGNSLDGIPFTVDATNQNYCITDFHKKFAPRCCVCREPIMPEPGQEETVRVVALDRSFHLECYKCEDCGLLLSSEADGRGCYPLDDHVLCKSCNAQRVQVLTNRMTSEL
ncbi:zyxin [Scaptodrosophila lebanonensis]|uniref:Zyxin n=1 Tax=Drosophila lebanonensis TaxID=7225 RepID=A0A6J2TUJ0_DROLE|nr:zyxin [Scaptodrosophila lebanonensis]